MPLPWSVLGQSVASGQILGDHYAIAAGSGQLTSFLRASSLLKGEWGSAPPLHRAHQWVCLHLEQLFPGSASSCLPCRTCLTPTCTPALRSNPWILRQTKFLPMLGRSELPRTQSSSSRIDSACNSHLSSSLPWTFHFKAAPTPPHPSLSSIAPYFSLALSHLISARTSL